MNVEEAKDNIGKEVVLDESTKPYGNCESYFPDSDNKRLESIPVFVIHNVDCEGDVRLKYKGEWDEDRHWGYIHPRHLKLKEQDMNYKIRVTPETSKEVQELFFELGFEWANGKDIFYSEYMKILYVEDCQIFYRESLEPVDGEYKEITLPQLRDMAVLKCNDVSDANRTDNVSKFYIGDSKVYQYHDSTWIECNLIGRNLKEIKKPKPQMTWKDAIIAKFEGKKVEVNNGEYWMDIAVCCIQDLEDFKEFRLKPKTVKLESREYSEEELLKLIEELRK